jgi:hypothetical protein
MPSRNGNELFVEVEPVCTLVGYAHPRGSTHIVGCVVIEFDSDSVLFMQQLSKLWRSAPQSPIVAMYENTVQVSFSVQKPKEEFTALINTFFPLTQVVDSISAIHVTSVANMFPEDPAYLVFKRCFERDGHGTLLMMEHTSIEGHEGSGVPFSKFLFTEVRDTFQKLAAE